MGSEGEKDLEKLVQKCSRTLVADWLSDRIEDFRKPSPMCLTSQHLQVLTIYKNLLKYRGLTGRFFGPVDEFFHYEFITSELEKDCDGYPDDDAFRRKIVFEALTTLISDFNSSKDSYSDRDLTRILSTSGRVFDQFKSLVFYSVDAAKKTNADFGGVFPKLENLRRAINYQDLRDVCAFLGKVPYFSESVKFTVTNELEKSPLLDCKPEEVMTECEYLDKDSIPRILANFSEFILKKENPIDFQTEVIRLYLNSKYARQDDEDKTVSDFCKLFKMAGPDKLRRILKEETADDWELLAFSNADARDFTLLKTLGRGAIKTAYLAENFNKSRSVLLMIDPNSQGVKHYALVHPKTPPELLMEKICEDEFSAVKIGESVHSKFVAKVSEPMTGVFTGKEVFFMSMRPYDSNLEAYIREVPSLCGEERRIKAMRYFSQMASGLLECHKNKIIHKDLKPDNIGIKKEGDHIILTDFGGAGMFSSTADCRYQYPLVLRPPELAYGDEHWRQKDVKWQGDLFTPEANVWTAGAILYMLLTGEPLFELGGKRAERGTDGWHAQNEQVYEQIRAFNPESLNEKFGEGSVEYRLLSRCLQKEVSARRGALEDCLRIISNEYPLMFEEPIPVPR